MAPFEQFKQMVGENGSRLFDRQIWFWYHASKTIFTWNEPVMKVSGCLPLFSIYWDAGHLARYNRDYPFK